MSIAAIVSLASCGGGSGDSGAVPPAAQGSGTLPLYQTSAELLTLPQLQAGGKVYRGVKLRLRRDGTWSLESGGTVGAALPGDSVNAQLGAPGNTADLADPNTDATLSIGRLHVDGRVLGNVSVRLTRRNWSLAGDFRELKTLGVEDFQSNTAIQADESHHVVIHSQAALDTQSVPLRLQARAYRFCMDAQDEGADRLTLLDPAGKQVFAIRAGDPCASFTAQTGQYTLQHRYGGKGASRSLFLRNQANTTTAAAVAQTGAARAQRSVVRQPLARAPSRDVGQQLFSGTEMWEVYVPAKGTSAGYLGDSFGAACQGTLGLSNSSALAGTNFLSVIKDAFNTPIGFDAPGDCVTQQLQGQYSLDATSIVNINPAQFTSIPNNLALDISNLSGIAFQLTSHLLPVVPHFPTSAALGFRTTGELGVGGDLTSGWTPDTFNIATRFFPDGVPAGVSLGAGQVALYSGANCTGAAIISEGLNLNSVLANYLPGGQFGDYQYLFRSSVQVGLQTNATLFAGAYEADGFNRYAGASQLFNQLSCTNVSDFKPLAMQVTVQTVTMVISTDSCEYCNLADVDLSKQSLKTVKLQHANLQGANLNGSDLTGADLRFTTLQGAGLANANLESADLCSASLNGNATLGKAANLPGAHLKNTNLAFADLDGVSLAGASFYSETAGVCQPTSCATYAASPCASAYQASFNAARFGSAYLANVDMSNATATGADFSNAVLLGVSFAGAQLGPTTGTGAGTSFHASVLQGVNFANAGLRFADFSGAAVAPAETCSQAMVSPLAAMFPGYQNLATGKCAAGTETANFCVQANYIGASALPVTDCTNTCSDGTGSQFNSNTGACTAAFTCAASSWPAATSTGLPAGSCSAAAPLCGAAFTSTQNTCW